MVGFDINCLLYQYILLVRDICEKYQLRSKVDDNTKYFKTSKRVLVLGMNRDASALAFAIFATD
jgi:hypothetical protein